MKIVWKYQPQRTAIQSYRINEDLNSLVAFDQIYTNCSTFRERCKNTLPAPLMVRSKKQAGFILDLKN